MISDGPAAWKSHAKACESKASSDPAATRKLTKGSKTRMRYTAAFKWRVIQFVEEVQSRNKVLIHYCSHAFSMVSFLCTFTNIRRLLHSDTQLSCTTYRRQTSRDGLKRIWCIVQMNLSAKAVATEKASSTSSIDSDSEASNASSQPASSARKGRPVLESYFSKLSKAPSKAPANSKQIPQHEEDLLQALFKRGVKPFRDLVAKLGLANALLHVPVKTLKDWDDVPALQEYSKCHAQRHMESVDAETPGTFARAVLQHRRKTNHEIIFCTDIHLDCLAVIGPKSFENESGIKFGEIQQ